MSLCICDDFNGGIHCETIHRDESWKWQDNSLRSEQSGTNSCSNISMYVQGPCNVSFIWTVGEGYNQLSLIDNDNLTAYTLGSADLQYLRHSHVGPVDITYSINDYNKHEIKWMHVNHCGRGKAWIDDICITEPPVVFKDGKVTPIEGISGSASCTGFDSQKFKYTINVSSKLDSPFEVELFTTAPNITVKQKVPHGRKLYNGTELIWDSIKLDCNDYGNGTYQFIAYTSIGTIESQIYPGPLITNFVVETKRISGNYSSISENKTYCIRLVGNRDKTLNLYGLFDGIWQPFNTSKLYIANETQGFICWNDIEYTRDVHPEEVEIRSC